jgi:hypothetical protein
MRVTLLVILKLLGNKYHVYWITHVSDIWFIGTEL